MTVEPIRDKAKIKRMYRFLKLRISVVIPLRARDIMSANLQFQDYLILEEKKTGKEKKIKINDGANQDQKDELYSLVQL